MCEIYVKADPMLYESRARSLRIHGFVTKIRLENLFWDILAELRARLPPIDQATINEAYRGEVENFALSCVTACAT
jgi:predicted DNA-binding ribbon-helix-helix protein